jgi:hypothetical protein
MPLSGISHEVRKRAVDATDSNHEAFSVDFTFNTHGNVMFCEYRTMPISPSGDIT